MEVYFDNSSTTKIYDEIIDEIVAGMKKIYGNPSALHTIGLECDKKLRECRQKIASIICANENEIHFNSGGSEGNNFIIKGFLSERLHIITTPFEHASILNTLKGLSNQNIKITYLNINSSGKVDLQHLKDSITKDPTLVSIMHVNNEIGTVQDLETIGNIIKETSTRAKFHVDCVQSFGKFEIDVKKMHIDFLTVSAHKFHGPNGCGFVYVKNGNNLTPLISGGSQEFGLRAGTQNIPGIMGLTKAALITNNNMKENYEKVLSIKKKFISRLSEIDAIRINSPDNDDFSPYILNVSFLGVRGEVLLHFLEGKNIYVSTGSACSSKEREKSGGSYVLKTIKLTNKEVDGGIRFSFSDDNELDEVDYVIDAIKEGLLFLRRIKK